jgi:hypothetical protein
LSVADTAALAALSDGVIWCSNPACRATAAAGCRAN